MLSSASASTFHECFRSSAPGFEAAGLHPQNYFPSFSLFAYCTVSATADSRPQGGFDLPQISPPHAAPSSREEDEQDDEEHTAADCVLPDRGSASEGCERLRGA